MNIDTFLQCVDRKLQKDCSIAIKYIQKLVLIQYWAPVANYIYYVA